MMMIGSTTMTPNISISIAVNSNFIRYLAVFSRDIISEKSIQCTSLSNFTPLLFYIPTDSLLISDWIYQSQNNCNFPMTPYTARSIDITSGYHSRNKCYGEDCAGVHTLVELLIGGHDQHWVDLLEFEGENQKNDPSVDLRLSTRYEMHRFCIIALRCDYLSRFHSIHHPVEHGKRCGI